MGKSTKLKMKQKLTCCNVPVQLPRRLSNLLMCTNVKAMLLFLLGTTSFIENAVCQLPDNGNRQRDYNDNGYNGGSSTGSTQTLLEVVKSINYLSEVSYI